VPYMKTPTHCNRSVDFAENGIPSQQWFRGNFVTAQRCGKCGYIFFPPPDLEVLSEYYQHEYPEAAKSWYNPEMDYKEDKCQSLMAQILSIASRFGISGRLSMHECGCSFGGTVLALRNSGHDATGTELNQEAINQARLRGNEWIYCEDEAAFFARTGRKVDVLYGYHCLEHMPDPANCLGRARPHLSDRAIGVFFVPNVMYRPALQYGYDTYDWYAYPSHLHMYSPRSLLCLAEGANFELLDVASNIKDAPSPPPGTRSCRPIPEALLERDWLGKELCFVITPIDSLLAAENSDRIMLIRDQCLIHGLLEKRMMEYVSSATVSPNR